MKAVELYNKYVQMRQNVDNAMQKLILEQTFLNDKIEALQEHLQQTEEEKNRLIGEARLMDALIQGALAEAQQEIAIQEQIVKHQEQQQLQNDVRRHLIEGAVTPLKPFTSEIPIQEELVETPPIEEVDRVEPANVEEPILDVSSGFGGIIFEDIEQNSNCPPETLIESPAEDVRAGKKNKRKGK